MTAPVLADDLPNPLLPPEVDLTRLPSMMVNIDEVEMSPMLLKVADRALRAAVLLLFRSWRQKPAGSLPNDDGQLAYLAGLGAGPASTRRWLKIKDQALQGWVLCSDGRYYNAMVTEWVTDAWQRIGGKAPARSTGKPARTRPKSKGAERTRRWRERQNVDESASNAPAGDVCDASDARDGGVTPVTVEGVTCDVTSPPKGKGKIKNKPSPQSPPAGGDEGRGVENPLGSGTADGSVPPDPETLPAPKTRIPEDWQPTADDRAFAAELGLSAQRVEAETARFVDYWLSQGTCRASWSRTWRNRIRDFAERNGLTENGMPKANAASPPDRDDRPPGPGADDPQWQAIAKAFRRLDRRGEEDWRSWLRQMGFQGIEGGTLVLTGQSRFAADKVRQLLGDRLRDAALAAGIEIDDVEVVVSQAPPQSPAQSPPAPIAAAAMAAQSPPARVAA